MAPLWGRRAFVTRGIVWVAWVVLALVTGSLVAVLTSGGGLVLALAAGATLAAAGLGPRLAKRWPALRGPLMWTALVLAGLAVLVASVRNTPLGAAAEIFLSPVRWISVALASCALVVALVWLRRCRRGAGVAGPRRDCGDPGGGGGRRLRPIRP